jgi:hypothetical protein
VPIVPTSIEKNHPTIPDTTFGTTYCARLLRYQKPLILYLAKNAMPYAMILETKLLQTIPMNFAETLIGEIATSIFQIKTYD